MQMFWVFSKGFWWRVTRGAFKLISNVPAIVSTIVQMCLQLFQQLFKCFCNCFNNCSNVSTIVSTIVQMFLQLFQQLFKCFCNCFNNCSNVAAILSIICSKVSGIVWLFQQRFRQNQQFSIMVSKSTQIFRDVVSLANIKRWLIASLKSTAWFSASNKQNRIAILGSSCFVFSIYRLVCDWMLFWFALLGECWACMT